MKEIMFTGGSGLLGKDNMLFLASKIKELCE